MLILELDLATVNLALDIHKLSESLQNVCECSVPITFYVIKFVSSILDWLNIEDVIVDSSDKIIDLLLILVLGGNHYLLIEVVDTNNVADEGL